MRACPGGLAPNRAAVAHTGGVSLDLDDELTVPLTLEAAARAACVTRRTVTRWIASGRLPSHTGPDGRTYVIESELLDVERERRHSRNPGRPGARPPKLSDLPGIMA